MSAVASIEEIVTQSRWATTVGKVCDQFGGEVQTGPFGSQLHASDYSEDGTKGYPLSSALTGSRRRLCCPGSLSLM